MVRKVKRRKKRRKEEEHELGRIMEVVYRFRRFLCYVLVHVSRRLYIIPPDIRDICHYAQCRACKLRCWAQGWRVEFKDKNNEIYEVTFKAVKTLQSEGFEDKEEEDEEDEDEEFKVRRPRRLTVGRKRPKTPKGEFYVV